MTPIFASFKGKEEEKENISIHEQKRKPKYNIGDAVTTAGMRKVFLEVAITKWRHELHTFAELIGKEIPNYRVAEFLGRSIETLFMENTLTVKRSENVLKKLSLKYFISTENH